MNGDNNSNSGCSSGCLIAILIVCFVLILILLQIENSFFLIVLVLCFAYTPAKDLYTSLKTDKETAGTQEEMRLLMRELNKEVIHWPDSQKITVKEHVGGKISTLQLSPQNKKLAIVRYDSNTASADLRVYHFSEIVSWKTRAEKTPSAFLGLPCVNEISVELCIHLNGKSINHKITLHTGRVYANLCELQLNKIKDIQALLSYIKPESH